MRRRLFLMLPTPRESDHIFTSFDVPVTPVVAVQAQASGWQAQALPRRLSDAKYVEQHEGRNQPPFFPEERTSCSGGRNRWHGTDDGKRVGFGKRWIRRRSR
jgi:hypothetical protein